MEQQDWFRFEWFWVLVAASLFAEPLNVGFGFLAREVDLLTNLGDALVVACWLYVNDETLLIGCANDPPIRESQIREGEEESAWQINPELGLAGTASPSQPLRAY